MRRSWSAAFAIVPRSSSTSPRGRDAVDVGEIADMAADLRGQVGLDVVGPALLQQGIGVVFIGNGEFEAVDDFVHSGRLLGGSIDDHGLVGRGDLAGEGDHAVVGTHLDGKLGRQGPPSERADDATREGLRVKRDRCGRRRRGLGVRGHDGRCRCWRLRGRSRSREVRPHCRARHGNRWRWRILGVGAPPGAGSPAGR